MFLWSTLSTLFDNIITFNIYLKALERPFKGKWREIGAHTYDFRLIAGMVLEELLVASYTLISAHIRTEGDAMQRMQVPSSSSHY